MEKQAVIAIPARLESSRYPRKVLAEVAGQPVLWHVCERAKQSKVGSVFVLTDSLEIHDLALSWGVEVLLTGVCTSGTERIASMLAHLPGDFIVCVPGDEPLIAPETIKKMVSEWRVSGCELLTVVYPLRKITELHNSDIVKVAISNNFDSIYFSRSIIPASYNQNYEKLLHQNIFFGHIGIYGYTRYALSLYTNLPKSVVAEVESLEQLRYLDAGYRFRVLTIDATRTSVDRAEDLELVRRILEEST
jgi:3-deoxy-manno-octulosonate cytidylyltransferase (CMP-KDO synthetase)